MARTLLDASEFAWILSQWQGKEKFLIEIRRLVILPNKVENRRRQRRRRSLIASEFFLHDHRSKFLVWGNFWTRVSFFFYFYVLFVDFFSTYVRRRRSNGGNLSRTGMDRWLDRVFRVRDFSQELNVVVFSPTFWYFNDIHFSTQRLQAKFFAHLSPSGKNFAE